MSTVYIKIQLQNEGGKTTSIEITDEKNKMLASITFSRQAKLSLD